MKIKFNAKFLSMICFAILFCQVSISQDKIPGMQKAGFDEFTGTQKFVLWGSTASSGCDLIAFVGPELKKPQLYVRFGYEGSDWIYFDKIYFKYTYNNEVKTAEIKFPIEDKREDVSVNSGPCLEQVDILATNEILDILIEVSDSKDVLLRLQGAGRYKNFKYYSYWLPPYKKAINGFRSIMQNNSNE